MVLVPCPSHSKTRPHLSEVLLVPWLPLEDEASLAGGGVFAMRISLEDEALLVGGGAFAMGRPAAFAMGSPAAFARCCVRLAAFLATRARVSPQGLSLHAGRRISAACLRHSLLALLSHTFQNNFPNIG